MTKESRKGPSGPANATTLDESRRMCKRARRIALAIVVSIVAVAEREGSTTVEDLVIEVDLETGAVTELADFAQLMAEYVDEFTHAIGPTDPFFWQAGELDWIHLTRSTTVRKRTPSWYPRTKRPPS